jgi:hypothetical protein
MRALSDDGREAGLEVDEDLPFQRTMWRIERVGWGLFAVIVLGAVAGLFGEGPMSQATLETSDPGKPGHTVRLEYERFVRSHSDSRLNLSLPSPPPDTGDAALLSVWFSGEYLSAVDMGRISPEPVYEELDASGVRYYFRLHDGPQQLIFRFRPQRAGSLSGSLRVNDGPATDFQQTIYP